MSRERRGFSVVECKTCPTRRKGELYEIGRWMQIFYQILVRHEVEALSRYVFRKYPSVVLARAGVGAYTVDGHAINIPYVQGGPLHRLFKEREKVTAELWWSQVWDPLRCVLCSFDDDFLAYREMPSTFMLKQHQYYCPTLVVIDNRRPHLVKGKVTMSFRSKIFTEKDIPELAFYECRLNHLGNMAFYPCGSIFPRLLDKLFLNSLSNRAVHHKNRIKELQKCINTGEVERAVLPQLMSKKTKHPKKTNKKQAIKGKGKDGEQKKTSGGVGGEGYGNSQQARLKEIQTRGFSSTAKRYKDVLANDFHCLAAPFECFKLPTIVESLNEFRTLDSSEFHFFDPCYTCDGQNVGKTVSLALGVVISFQLVPTRILMGILRTALERFAEKKAGAAAAGIAVIFNGGEVIKRYSCALRWDGVTRVREFFKTTIGLVEVLGFGTETDARLLTVHAFPYVPYTFADGLFYSPSEMQDGRRKNARIMSLVMLPVPFPNHNHAPKNQFVASAMRQATQFFPECRLPFLAPSHGWSLVYPQSPFADNRQQSFPLYSVNVLACIMCLQGFNQEDAVVLNKSSVERGMFLTNRYGNYRVTFDFDPAPRVSIVGEIGKPLVKGAILARIATGGSLRTYNTELSVKKSGGFVYEVVWIEDKLSPLLYDISFVGNEVLRVVVRSLHQIAIGDKVVSCTGQKGVVAAIIPEEDLPILNTPNFTGVPNLVLHPSFLKRQTLSLVLEGINRHLKLVPFPHLESSFGHAKTKTLLKIGKEIFTGPAYCGTTGREFKNKASFYEISYEVLSIHCSCEKCYATMEMSLRARDLLTGHLRKGKSHFGAAGFSSSDVDVVLGHGAVSVLSECMFTRSDDTVVKRKNADPVRLGAATVRYMDDRRMLKSGFDVEIQPKVQYLGPVKKCKKTDC